MGVANTLMGSTAMDSEVDLIDIGAIVLLSTMAPLLFGVWSWQIEVFGGYDFSAALFVIGGINISLTLLVIIFSVGWIVLTNLINDDTDMGQYETGVVVAAIALPVLYVFVPAVEGLVTWHDMMRLAASLWVALGATYLSYVG